MATESTKAPPERRSSATRFHAPYRAPEGFQPGDRVAWDAFADVDAGEGILMFKVGPIEPGGGQCWDLVVAAGGVPDGENRILVPESPESNLRAISTWSETPTATE